MNIYEAKNIGARIAGNPYVGRGIVIGKTADGTKAAVAYFIMGRSANSRNRVFRLKDGALYTEPFDLSRVEDIPGSYEISCYAEDAAGNRSESYTIWIELE